MAKTFKSGHGCVTSLKNFDPHEGEMELVDPASHPIHPATGYLSPLRDHGLHRAGSGGSTWGHESTKPLLLMDHNLQAQKDEIAPELSRILWEESKFLIPMHTQIYAKALFLMVEPFIQLAQENKITKIVALEASGLLFGCPIAHQLNLPLVPVLKHERIYDRSKAIPTEPYVDYSGKPKRMEIFESTVGEGDRLLIVDDWLETGNTCYRTIQLLEGQGATIVGITAIFNQLRPRSLDFFQKYNFHFVVRLEPNDEVEDTAAFL